MLDTAYSGARNLVRRQTTPDRLILDVVVLVIACAVFGIAVIWTARTHSGAARDLASSDGRLLQDLGRAATAAAQADNAKWQVVHHKLMVSNDSGGYSGAVVLAIGTGPDDVPAEFDPLRTDLDGAARGDQLAFGRDAAAARDATGYLAAALVVPAVLALGGALAGLGVRIREYW